MKMKLKQALMGVAAMLVLAATQSSAQFTNTVAIAGSSALYNEVGQASYAASGCAWTDKSKDFTLNDTRLALTAGIDIGTAWVTWYPTSDNCANPNITSTTPVTFYVSTDSTVGNRCFFASPRCTITAPSAISGAAGGNALPGVTDTALPSAVYSAINGASENMAATDIRPEDAMFATLRVLTPCGTSVVSGSQYLGLGYVSAGEILGSSHQTSGGGGGFNIANFALMGTDPYSSAALPGAFTVTPVGAVPVVVFVNPSNPSGFGSLQVSNIDRAVLAGYLDGTYGSVTDVIPGPYSTGAATTVYLREPLSGTYNTMEYAIPNSVQNQSSQDVGLAAQNASTNLGVPFPPYNCVSGAFALPTSSKLVSGSTANPLTEGYKRSSTTSGAASYRARAIGTGNEVKAVLATEDSLGYAFWSAANFSSANAQTGKYLTVDGIDPLQQVWSDGLIPTSGNDLLGNVSLAHVKDGSYPIWSILRLVTDTAANNAFTAGQATKLASAAVTFLSPSQPDFVPLSQLGIVRSHFAPPGVNFPGGACSGTPPSCTPSNSPEAGGDVAGLVYTQASDGAYNADTGQSTGNTGHRQ
jgi:hypothetical protein